MLKTRKLPFVAPRKGPAPLYPFRTMEVKTSFVVPKKKFKYRSLVAYACSRGKALNRRFTVVLLADGNCQVYRVK